jgi:mannan endo-1,4-beta-mannosidase
MKKASDAAGKRLLDVLDVHWYPPEDDGNGHGICDDREDPRTFNARMQAPRTLWDTSYVYPNTTYPNGGSSWVNKSWNAAFLPVLTRFKSDIQNYFPDTNIAITEYTWGPAHQWATGITTADFLGICGKYGVYITNYWGQGGYIDTAVKIYRNYDGFHSTYGDTNVPATMSDKVNSSVYASISDSNNFPLHIIVLNKNQDNAINGTFTITSSHSFSSGRVFAFDASGSNIREITPISNITGNSFTYTVPIKSVCHIVLDGPPCQLNYDFTGDCHVNMLDLDVLANHWLGGDCSAEPNCTDFNGDLNVNFTDFSIFSQEWKINE